MREWTSGPYRMRTMLRGMLPARPALYALVRKGRDCGDRHEFYRADADTDACYHCRQTRPTGS